MTKRSERLPGQILGDYRLSRMVSRDAGVKVWEAEQISVRRRVILEILRQDWVADAGVRQSFIEDARAKARINHKVVGHVYEAADGDVIFLARESLEGSTLESHRRNGLQLRPREVAGHLRQIASAYLYFESQGVATVALSDQHLHFDQPEQRLQMANIVRDGSPDPWLDRTDKEKLAAIYQDLLEPKKDGSVRVASLLEHLGDANREFPVTWQQLHDLASEIEESLPLPEELAMNASGKRLAATAAWAAKKRIGIMVGLSLLCFGAAAKLDSNPSDEDLPVAPAMRWVSPAKGRTEYADRPVRRDQFAHFLKDQGKDAEQFFPVGWSQQWTDLSASERQKQAGEPVTGVSYAAAVAFAQSEGAALPTVEDYQKMQGKISRFTNLASPHPEWTATQDLYPTDPLGELRPVAVYLRETLIPKTGPEGFADVTFRIKRD